MDSLQFKIILQIETQKHKIMFPLKQDKNEPSVTKDWQLIKDYVNFEFIFYHFRHYMQAIIGAYGMLSLELTINNIAKEDYGTYRCMASTVQGSTVGQVQLIGE